MLERISKKSGFTVPELKVILFLCFTLIAGFSYKTFIKEKNDAAEVETFDYSSEDSLFHNPPGDITADSLMMNMQKEVDYKQEVLNFNPQSFKKSEKKTLPAENSINLNTAKLEDLTKLPGIGPKTAQAMLDLRSRLGNFKTIDDLLQVKGIGKTKLNNIKKYIFIE